MPKKDEIRHDDDFEYVVIEPDDDGKVKVQQYARDPKAAGFNSRTIHLTGAQFTKTKKGVRRS